MLPARPVLTTVKFLTLATVLVAGFAGSFPLFAQCSADPWADVIVQSTRTVGNRSNVLGAPDGNAVDFDDENGKPGFVTVAFFDDVIVDGAGDDFAVHLVDFAASEYREAFELWVSPDGDFWVSLGVVRPTAPYQDMPETRTFDLQPTGLTTVTQIRVVATAIDRSSAHENVDLDAFEALNCVPAADTGLGACEADLDECETQQQDCSSELLTCEGELESAADEADRCRDNLDQTRQELEQTQVELDAAQANLEVCDESLAAAQTELETLRAGLAEVERLLRLPPGQRTAGSFDCSGTSCDELLQLLRMLTGPPGQNVRRNVGRR